MRKVWILLVFDAIGCGSEVQGRNKGALQLVQTVDLPDVSGRIDHMDVDLSTERLFVAALGNNTVEVVGLRAGQKLHSVTGFREPQGLVFLAASNCLFVADGGNGSGEFIDSTKFERTQSVQFASDADNVRYDAAAGRVYVGYGGGAIGIVDAANGQRLGDIPLDGHPEGFALDRTGTKIYVNVPNAGHVAVLDRERREVVARWAVRDASANYPIALDEANHRLFIGCRSPAKLVVLDATTGQSVASVEIDGDTDDVFYDARRQQIYVACGAGFVDVISISSPDHYEVKARVQTASGARTALYVAEMDRLFVAAPKSGGQAARVLVYQPASDS